MINEIINDFVGDKRVTDSSNCSQQEPATKRNLFLCFDVDNTVSMRSYRLRFDNDNTVSMWANGYVSTLATLFWCEQSATINLPTVRTCQQRILLRIERIRFGSKNIEPKFGKQRTLRNHCTVSGVNATFRWCVWMVGGFEWFGERENWVQSTWANFTLSERNDTMGIHWEPIPHSWEAN